MKHKVTKEGNQYVKYVSDDFIVVELNGEEIKIPKKKFSNINKEIKDTSKILNHFNQNKFFNKTLKPQDFEFYHKELMENMRKYLFGRDTLTIDDIWDSEHCELPYMKIKNMVEGFQRMGLLNGNKVVYKSEEDLPKYKIEAYDED